MFLLTEPPVPSSTVLILPPPGRKLFLPVCPSSKGAQNHQACRWLGAPTRDTPRPNTTLNPLPPSRLFVTRNLARLWAPLQIQNLQPVMKDERARKAKQRCGDAAQGLGGSLLCVAGGLWAGTARKTEGRSPQAGRGENEPPNRG